MEQSIVVLSHQDVIRQTNRGAVLLDLRPPRQYVQIHLANSLSVSGPRFGMATLLDNRLAPSTRLVLVADTAATGQVAADQLKTMGIHVIGVLASQPSTWQPRGLTVVRGILVRPNEFLQYLGANPSVDLIDVRETVEQQQYPFAPVTRNLPFSMWPDILPQASESNAATPLVFVAGHDERSVLAAWWAFQRGYHNVGYLVGGMTRYLKGDGYDPRAMARTTARHGVFI